jgi:hypothetical protein
MSGCYVCAVHDDPTPDPTAVGACATCGVFTCVYDGARVHAKGQYRCAICLVRVLIESAGVALPSGDPGGGGAAATAQVRAFLATDDFERDAEQLATRSRPQRYAWRQLFTEQYPPDIAREFGERLDQLAGPDTAVAKQVEAAIVEGAADLDLLADAAGVGEYARRLSITGRSTLPSVAAADAEKARQELARKQAAEAAIPDRAEEKIIGATTQAAEEAPALKTMTMGGGES